MEDLPENVLVDILSRLPVKTIINCKCVCKRWLHLLSNSYFANLHLSRLPTSRMFHHTSVKEKSRYLKPGILKWVEFELELELELELNRYHIRGEVAMSLDLSLSAIFQNSQILLRGSVNGLLCLWQYGHEVSFTYICNPITREYMILPNPLDPKCFGMISQSFGVGSLTREYKVIGICDERLPPSSTSTRLSPLQAKVYTLGTGQWRSLGRLPFFPKEFDGLFLNGHAHWIFGDQDSPHEKLYAFDFDKETFKLFPSPPVETIQGSRVHFQTLSVLKGCLCHSETFDSQFTMWVMKEYGVKQSWHKDVIIKQQSISPNLDWLMCEPIYPIERLDDGTVFMVYKEDKLLIYSSQTKTIADTGFFDRYINGMPYRPSFLTLRNFKSEIVNVF